MDILVWLRSLGLGKYEAAFRENDIDEAVLPNLTVVLSCGRSFLGCLCGPTTYSIFGVQYETILE
jgi:hypothetical protein